MINENKTRGDSEKEPEKTIETPKENERTKMEELNPEQIAQYEAYMEANPEPPVPEKERESGQEVLELEALIASCESKYPIEELYLILTQEVALNNSARNELKQEIIPILKSLQKLEKETDISSDKLAELKLKYKHLSNAIGFINSGRVDHDR